MQYYIPDDRESAHEDYSTTPPSSLNRNVWFTEQFGNILDFFGPTGGPADVSTGTVGTLYVTSQAAPDINEGMVDIHNAAMLAKYGPHA